MESHRIMNPNCQITTHIFHSVCWMEKKMGVSELCRFGWSVSRAFASSALTCCWVSLWWKNWFDPVQCCPKLVRSAFVSSGSPAGVQPAGKEPSGAMWGMGRGKVAAAVVPSCVRNKPMSPPGMPSLCHRNRSWSLCQAKLSTVCFLLLCFYTRFHNSRRGPQ